MLKLFYEAEMSNIKRKKWKLCGVYITHITNYPVFPTNQATEKIKSLYDKL